MKKIISLLILVLGFSVSQVMAQEVEVKAKATTTPRDKVHNVFHPRHRWHHGHKYKYTKGTYKRKVTIKNGKTKVETKL